MTWYLTVEDEGNMRMFGSYESQRREEIPVEKIGGTYAQHSSRNQRVPDKSTCRFTTLTLRINLVSSTGTLWRD